MFKIDLKSKLSIYEQVIDGIKEEMVTGRLAPGDKLPSVRDLSALLTVNPNTIQKAYRELENQGYIYSVSGRGNFVSETDRPLDMTQVNAIYDAIATKIKELRFLGIDEKDIRYKIMNLTNEGGNRND